MILNTFLQTFSNTNNLVFGGIVIASTTFIYCLRYSSYLGYKMFTSKTESNELIDYSDIDSNFSSSSSTISDHTITHPLPNRLSITTDICNNNISPYNLHSSYSHSPSNLFKITSDVSIQTTPLTSDIEIQTSDDLLFNYFNKLIEDMQSETSSHNYTSFIYSPVSPSVRINDFLQSIPRSQGIQTEDTIHNIEPIYNSFQEIDLADLYLLLI
jgi:hypothetical protein